MAKTNTPEVKEEQKIQTKYDRKMAARKLKEEKDKRDEKIFKIVSSAIGIALILAIVISVGASIVKKQTALHGTYVQIGDRDVSQLEYDFYYNSAVSNYLSMYGSLVSYMGLDTTQDFADQPYDDNMSWKDMFDQMAVDQMKQIFALIDDAEASGFEYDDTEDFEERIASYKSAAESSGISESEFYKSAFGDYATKSNLTPFIKESIFASAYYDHLIELNAPSAEEIADYYNENPQNYDKVDYRSFQFTADIAEDASEDDIAKAMAKTKEKAEAFREARASGSDFEELCIENASEDEKADYEDEATEKCLSEGQFRAYTPSAISSWLYDDARAENDLEVIEDTESNSYYVVEFVNRYYDAEESDAEISDLLSSNVTTEYISGLVEKYEVTDPKGNLKYLTIETSDDTETESTENAEGTETSETTEN